MPSNTLSILHKLTHLFKSRFMGFQKMPLLKDQINDEWIYNLDLALRTTIHVLWDFIVEKIIRKAQNISRISDLGGRL